jgi:hypothetical protein
MNIDTPSETPQNAFKSLLGPNGQATTNLGGFSTTGAFFDTFRNGLPVTGTFTLRVDPSAVTVDCAALTVFDVPADSSPSVTPTAAGAAATVCITVPGDAAGLPGRMAASGLAMLLLLAGNAPAEAQRYQRAS